MSSDRVRAKVPTHDGGTRRLTANGRRRTSWKSRPGGAGEERGVRNSSAGSGGVVRGFPDRNYTMGALLASTKGRGRDKQPAGPADSQAGALKPPLRDDLPTLQVHGSDMAPQPTFCPKTPYALGATPAAGREWAKPVVCRGARGT